MRVKVESITHKKAYFEPRFYVNIFIQMILMYNYFVHRQGIHGLFGWNLIKDSTKEVCYVYMLYLLCMLTVHIVIIEWKKQKVVGCQKF